ncbi:MAG: acyl-CoA desaturase [Segetibacter sp.]|nr:acyl-CoA desaturase [Segetibacter sp.]
MHRMHHEFSDTEQDPHSPHFFKDVWQMMRHTAKIYQAFLDGTMLPDQRFTKDYLPVWHKLDRIGYNNITRVLFGLGYIAFYVAFAPSFWWYLLLPIHFLMGPVQGAIVNWFGHKLGYSNFSNGDHSKNTEPFGIFLLGELFQNNHHAAGTNPNFARKWYELDPTFQVMKVMNFIGIIKLKPVAVAASHSVHLQQNSIENKDAVRA